MVDILAVLDSREKAALAWLALGITLALRSKDIRSSLVSILKTLMSKQLLSWLGATIAYVTFIVLSLERTALWDVSLTKDTVVWFFGPAMLMVFNHGQANSDAAYFKKTLYASLRLALLLEFLVNFYVFYFYIELIFVPFMFVLMGMLVVSASRSEHGQIKRSLEFVINAVGLFVVSYALVMLTTDFGLFATGRTIKLFVLPIALTVLFIPLIYVMAVYSGYEGIYVRIRENELASYIKRQVLRTCLFRLGRVNRFLSEYTTRLRTVRSKADVNALFAEFRSH